MRPWPNTYTMLEDGRCMTRKGDPVNKYQCNCKSIYARPRLIRYATSFDPYSHFFEKYFQELKDDEQVFPLNFDYVTPWNLTEPMLINESTCEILFENKVYTRLPKVYCDKPKYFINPDSSMVSLNMMTPAVVKAYPMGRLAYYQVKLTDGNL